MRRGRTELETCELNGWGVGTRLVGNEGYGPTTIRITYLSSQNLLAVREGGRYDGYESSWTLACRDWTEVQSTEETNHV